MPQNKMGQNRKSLQPGPLQQWPDSAYTVYLHSWELQGTHWTPQRSMMSAGKCKEGGSSGSVAGWAWLRVQWALTAAQQHWPQWFASFQGREFRLLSSPSFCTAFTCSNALAGYLSWGSLPASCGTRAVGWPCMWTSSLHREIYKNITHCF